MVDFQVREGPDDASKKRFSWFPDWIPKVQRNVNLIDLVKSYPNSDVNLLPNLGFDTAENEFLKMCQTVVR